MSNQAIFRQKLIDSLYRELVGPDLPPYGSEVDDASEYIEVLQESPTQRYSAGVLFPQKLPINEVQNEIEDDHTELDPDIETPEIQVEDQREDVSRDGRVSDQLADAYDETIRMANEFFPSAIGVTFLSEYAPDGLRIEAYASQYHSFKPSEGSKNLREWKRNELKIDPFTIVLNQNIPHEMKEYELAQNLLFRIIYHRRKDNSYIITISLLNSKTLASSKPPSGSDCFFQVGLEVTSINNDFIFKEYRIGRKILSKENKSLDEKEEAMLELLYRKRKAYAIGHGCAADWGDEIEGHTNKIRTAILPQFKVPPVEPLSVGGEELSMFTLSGAEGQIQSKQIPIILSKLADNYATWINLQSDEATRLPSELQNIANENLETCGQCLERIRHGIDILKSDDNLLKAFMLANEAMLMQQYHSRLGKRNVEDPWKELPSSYMPQGHSSGRWRTFQITFILMNLPSITFQQDGKANSDREIVDLIWFPTGGGKTEAYLGLAACDIFYRRLLQPTNGGCTVLMRYTLRLLTSQQFQRASSMICACEIIRRNYEIDLGDEPITIGLWVGESLTPIYRAKALKALGDLAGKKSQSENPFQLLKCPWCGTGLDEHTHLGYVAHKFTGESKTVIFLCPEQCCPFSKRKKDRGLSQHLPVTVIDDDIYEWPPTLIIGTVDKFAMLAWRERAGRIFGLGFDNDYSPPDLIIQDELHLISGPLGSVVGLYESAIDLLCSWKGRPPKIVASTATIRRAWHQCKSLYDRPTFQFPPQGIDISDSYFAKEHPEAPSRVYVGVFASAAPSFVTAMIRTLSALFQSCNSIQLPDGAQEETRDPYWTIIQYFNSLRELGHAATLVEADIPEYMWAIASRSHLPKELCRSLGSPVELTSRRTADEIPEILERLNVRYPRASKQSPRPLDTLLATNMISVGVDVDRLGMMVIVGQPKTTSEYIQASSRVGRSHSAPGLVVTMYNPGKPRDRSHYEHFRTYHAAFYKHVEPTSVTPFSLPVLERALHAVLVVLSRHFTGLKSPQQIDPASDSVKTIIDHICRRCQSVDSEHSKTLVQKLNKLLKEWSDILPSEWGRFGSPPTKRPLMYPAGSEPLVEWDDSPWPTPSSMRNVDVECDANVVATYEPNE